MGANKEKNTKKKLLITAAVTVGTIATARAINEITVKPISRVIKILFTGKYPGPKNYKEIKNNTKIIKDIPYGNLELNEVLDINMPINNSENLRPLVVLLHGGGFVGGSKGAIEAYARTLSSYGYIVANISYALAPEHVYPLPIIQVSKAIEYLKKNSTEYNIDFNNVFIGGGSAGAQIASQFAALQTNSELANEMEILPVLLPKQLKGTILLCGLYNMETVLDTKFPAMKEYLWSYTGEKNFLEYKNIDQLSTVKHITKLYPKTFITAGNKDKLLPQSKEFVKVLEENNINYTSIFFDNHEKYLGHQYQFNLLTKEAVFVLDKLVKFINNSIE